MAFYGEAIVEIREYVRIFWKRWWIIVLLVVITSGSAVVFSKLQRPVYRATIFLNVIPARLDWGLQQTIKNLLRNYSGQITSDATLRRVDEQLQLDMSPDMMRAKMRVDPIESDLLLQIAVEDYDPIIAKQIADAAADIFSADIARHMLDQDQRDRVDVSVRDYARPGSLFKPKWKVNALAGAVLGGLLGLLVVFFLEWLESDLIRSEDDVERHVGLAVLGAIPMAAGQAPSANPTRRRILPWEKERKGTR